MIYCVACIVPLLVTCDYLEDGLSYISHVYIIHKEKNEQWLTSSQRMAQHRSALP